MTPAALRAAAVAAALATAALGVAVFGIASRLPFPDPAASVANALFIVGMTVLTGTGALLIRDRPRSAMGWLLVGTGLAGVSGRLVFGLAWLAHDAGLAVADGLGWASNWVWVPMNGLALLMLLRFPDGTLPRRGWRWVETLVLVWTASTILVTAVLPGPLGAEELAPRTNPLGLPAFAAALDAATSAVFLVQPALVVLVVAAPVLRWRSAPAEQRGQLAVVGWALLFLALAAPLALVSGAGAVLEGLAWLVLPTAIGYAVVRHGLWGLDLRRRFDRLRRVREEERARLQRDLHDALGPLLGSITMRVEAARNMAAGASTPDELDRVLASIGQQAELAVVEVRRFIDELAPSALADTGLPAALRELAGQYAESGLAVELRAPAELPPLDPAVEVAMYRVASEALRNVWRHADATRCTVGIDVTGGNLELSVVDDGIGLRGTPPGVGRRAMADRIAALGGVLDLEDAPAGGVALSARVPVAEPVSEDAR